MSNEYKISITPDKNGKVLMSNNGHYAIYVETREEKEYPNSPIKRYEIVNMSTLAVEGRVSNLQMAILVMNEFDRRLEEIMTQGTELDEEGEPVGTPFEMDLGSTH